MKLKSKPKTHCAICGRKFKVADQMHLLVPAKFVNGKLTLDKESSKLVHSACIGRDRGDT